MYMIQRRSKSGFTTIELLLVLVIIGILATLVFTTRSGVQQNQRNNERQADIKELRDGLEGYFAANNRYPTLPELNDQTWRTAHLKALEADVFKDPSSSDNTFVDKARANAYAYSVTSASGTPCDSAKNPCTQYTLTATLEGGGSYTKNNLN
jgi:prepilin-type N-terminal cleavage/methylation domain-containing protein